MPDSGDHAELLASGCVLEPLGCRNREIVLIDLRFGKALPAPAAVDVSIHGPAESIESLRDEIVVLVSSETGPVDLAPVAQQHPKALPSDGRFGSW